MSTQEYTTTGNLNIPPPPTSLDDLPFWGVWKRENGTKVPYTPLTRRRAKPNDSGTFDPKSAAESALATGQYTGLCILVDESLGITGGDLDHIVAEDHAFDESKIPPAVWRLIRIANTWTCWSPSGTGIRFIFAASLGRRYMTKNKANRICIAEAYNRLRFMTVKLDCRITGTPEIFNPDADDLEAWHEALGFPLRGIEQPTAPRPAYSGGSHTGDEIVETARRVSGDKFRRLHVGDISGYPESQSDKGRSSEADLALVSILAGYTSDDDQVADLWRRSGLDRAKLDRDDYVNRTIASARSRQTWWFDWDRSPTEPTIGPQGARANGQHNHAGEPTPPSDATCPTQLAAANRRIRELEAGIAVRDETIAAQAEKIDRYSVTQTAIERILATDQIEGGPKLTAIALLMEEVDQQRRGRSAAPLGRHVPGSWISRRAGNSVDTANKHLKKMADAGLIERKVVRERVTEDTVDEDTGEIVPRGKTISRAYYPDQASTLIARFTSYERPADVSTHGGKREPRCKHHPNAPTTTTHVTRCDECDAILEERETHRHPTEWKRQDDVSTLPTPPVTSSKGDGKMTFPLDDEPPAYWTTPGGVAGDDHYTNAGWGPA